MRIDCFSCSFQYFQGLYTAQHEGIETKLTLTYYAQGIGKSYRSDTVYFSLQHTQTLLNGLCHKLSARQLTVINQGSH